MLVTSFEIRTVVWLLHISADVLVTSHHVSQARFFYIAVETLF